MCALGDVDKGVPYYKAEELKKWNRMQVYVPTGGKNSMEISYNISLEIY